MKRIADFVAEGKRSTRDIRMVKESTAQALIDTQRLYHQMNDLRYTSKQQKLNATANAFGAPIRPRHLVPNQQGVGTLAPNDLTPCRMAFYFR
jgi:hypothetical protein